MRRTADDGEKLPRAASSGRVQVRVLDCFDCFDCCDCSARLLECASVHDGIRGSRLVPKIEVESPGSMCRGSQSVQMSGNVSAFQVPVRRGIPHPSQLVFNSHLTLTSIWSSARVVVSSRRQSLTARVAKRHCTPQCRSGPSYDDDHHYCFLPFFQHTGSCIQCTPPRYSTSVPCCATTPPRSLWLSRPSRQSTLS